LVTSAGLAAKEFLARRIVSKPMTANRRGFLARRIKMLHTPPKRSCTGKSVSAIKWDTHAKKLNVGTSGSLTWTRGDGHNRSRNCSCQESGRIDAEPLDRRRRPLWSSVRSSSGPRACCRSRLTASRTIVAAGQQLDGRPLLLAQLATRLPVAFGLLIHGGSFSCSRFRRR
jgi:hypothetical protein